MAFPYLVKRNVITDFYIIFHLDAKLLNRAYLSVKNLFRKSVLRNSVSEHTAHLRHCIVNRDLVTLDGKEVCRRQSCGTSADYADCFSACFLHFRNKLIA